MRQGRRDVGSNTPPPPNEAFLARAFGTRTAGCVGGSYEPAMRHFRRPNLSDRFPPILSSGPVPGLAGDRRRSVGSSLYRKHRCASRPARLLLPPPAADPGLDPDLGTRSGALSSLRVTSWTASEGRDLLANAGLLVPASGMSD